MLLMYCSNKPSTVHACYPLTNSWFGCKPSGEGMADGFGDNGAAERFAEWQDNLPKPNKLGGKEFTEHFAQW